MEKYLAKLESSLRYALGNDLKQVNTIVVATGHKIKVVSIDTVSLTVKRNSLSIDLLLSGKDMRIDSGGEIFLWEKSELGESRKCITFWLEDSFVNYKHEESNFEIIDLGRFLALGLK